MTSASDKSFRGSKRLIFGEYYLEKDNNSIHEKTCYVAQNTEQLKVRSLEPSQSLSDRDKREKVVIRDSESDRGRCTTVEGMADTKVMSAPGGLLIRARHKTRGEMHWLVFRSLLV